MVAGSRGATVTAYQLISPYATSFLLAAALAAAAARPAGLTDTSNLDSHWERQWDHPSVRRKMLVNASAGLRELRVLHGPQGYERTDRVELQDELCSMLKVPREEAELWWYAEVGSACNQSADLPRIPPQEPALWAFVGPAVVTRFGAVLSNGMHVVLDPEHHGVCHRMRAPDDISPRSMPAGGDAGASHGIGWVRELYVISQPWGHTVFHFIAECLPKMTMALLELQHHTDIRVHVPLSTDDQRNAQRVMVEEYLTLLLPNVVQQERVVSGEISVTGTTYFVTPARCAVAQVPLLLRFRRYLFFRLQFEVATDKELQQELIDTSGCIPHLTDSSAYNLEHREVRGGASGRGRGEGAGASARHTTNGGEEHGTQGCGRGSVLVVLVKRAGRTRRFSRAFEKSIRQMIQQAGHGGGSKCRVRLGVYDADAGAAPKAVLSLFAAAQGVIAPHGAGLTNVVAAGKGLHVLEFHPSQPQHPASGIPGLNLCMLHLARALGFAYTGALMWPVEGEVDESSGEMLGTSWSGDLAVVASFLLSLHQQASCIQG